MRFDRPPLPKDGQKQLDARTVLHQQTYFGATHVVVSRQGTGGIKRTLAWSVPARDNLIQFAATRPVAAPHPIRGFTG